MSSESIFNARDDGIFHLCHFTYETMEANNYLRSAELSTSLALLSFKVDQNWNYNCLIG